jgi:putative Holliday junction resolvase
MPLFNLTELRHGLSRGQRLIGLDPGAKLIGLALTDVLLMLASPYAALKRGKLAANAAEILAIARKEGAGGLVIGLPLGMDGSFGPAAQAAKDWGLAISAATGLPAALWDERSSSAAVNRAMIAADVTRAKRAAAVDAAAAAYMLQSALDASRNAA